MDNQFYNISMFFIYCCEFNYFNNKIIFLKIFITVCTVVRYYLVTLDTIIAR